MSDDKKPEGLGAATRAQQFQAMLGSSIHERVRVLSELHQHIADVEKRLAVAEALLSEARRVHFHTVKGGPA